MDNPNDVANTIEEQQDKVQNTATEDSDNNTGQQTVDADGENTVDNGSGRADGRNDVPKYSFHQAQAIGLRDSKDKLDELQKQLDELKAEKEKAEAEAKDAELRGRMSVKKESYAKELGLTVDELPDDEKKLDDMASRLRAQFAAKQKHTVPMQAKAADNLAGW